MKKVLLVFGRRPESTKMAPLAKAFEKKNSIISKVCVTVNVLLDMKDVMRAFTPDIVLVHGNCKACQRIMEYSKSV